MALVAITRIPGAEQLAAGLTVVAQLSGLSAYEARLRLASALPLLLARALSLPEAQRWLHVLRGLGFGAVAVDEATLPVAERAVCPIDVELRDDAFVSIDRQGHRLALPLSELLAIVRAVEVYAAERTIESSERKLAIGRAVLSGGLVLSKEVRKEETELVTEAERTMYLFCSTGSDPIVLRQGALRYTGLGALRARTEHENFDRLATWLREHAKDAIYDEQMMARKRRPTLSAVTGTSKERLATSSNTDETALAAFVIVHAHLQKQI